MKKFMFSTGIFMILISLVMIFTSGVFANVNTRNDTVDNSTFKELIQTFLYNRASVMISDQRIKVNDSLISSQELEKENQTRTKISLYREKLKKLNETYSDLKTDVEILQISYLNNLKVSIKVKETTFFTIAQGGTETGYSAEHEFILEKNQNNEWLILEDRHLEPIGLLPLYEAEEYVYGNVDSNKIDSDSNLEYQEILNLSSNTNEKILSIKSGYNYPAMAAYLERYWSNYNPAYRNFNNQGGDCTNFVSQALKAGGWTDKPGWYQNANYWWYNNANQTYSWTSVNHWATFAINSGRASMLYNVWSCRVGDVVQVKPSGSSSKVHTMMVSYYSNGIPYFTYHSSNRYRRSLNQVLLDWIGATFYSYRT